MKKQSIILVLLLIQVAACLAQKDSAYAWPKEKPKYNIKLTTAAGDKISGMLVAKDDSSVVIFPGSHDRYNNKKSKSLHAAIYVDNEIEKIHLKHHNAVGRGALIGFGIGMIPVVAGLFAGKDKEGFAYVSVVTIPLGTIVGAIVGTAASRNFHIGGQRDKYRKFSTAVKL